MCLIQCSARRYSGDARTINHGRRSVCLPQRHIPSRRQEASQPLKSRLVGRLHRACSACAGPRLAWGSRALLCCQARVCRQVRAPESRVRRHRSQSGHQRARARHRYSASSVGRSALLCDRDASPVREDLRLAPPTVLFTRDCFAVILHHSLTYTSTSFPPLDLAIRLSRRPSSASSLSLVPCLSILSFFHPGPVVTLSGTPSLH